MHFNNVNEFKSNTNLPTATSTPTKSPTSSNSTSCSSSTDSGVIIIDNKTAFSNIGNSNSTNNNHYSKNNIKVNNNKAESTANDNKIHSQQQQNQGNNESNTFNIAKSVDKEGNSLAGNSDKTSSNAIKHINIENVINIGKTGENHNKNTNNLNNNYNINNVHHAKWAHEEQTSSPTKSSCSPTVSIRSTTISIISIDENAIDSSVIDSDSDCEADAEGMHSNYIVKKLGHQTTYPPDSPNIPNINKGLQVISQRINPAGSLSAGPDTIAAKVLNGNLSPPQSTPQIGSIALTNSTDVTFGDKHFYEGPVTIQQFLIDSREKSAVNGENAGHDNPNFSSDNAMEKTNSESEHSANRNAKLQEAGLLRLLNRKNIFITVAIIILTATLSGILITSLQQSSSAHKTDEDVDYDDDACMKSLCLVGREAWNAREPKNKLDKLHPPVSRVIIAHTAAEGCNKMSLCAYRINLIQGFHMDSFGWDDIAYNFLIGGNGQVFVGRGWDIMGSHTKGYNYDSIGIAFIGTFGLNRPPEIQIKAAQLLIEEGLSLNKIVPNYQLYGARQLGATESPGDALYKIIKTWPHWSSKVKVITS